MTADDGANTTAKLLTVNLTDVNDNAPVITTASPQSVAENTCAGGRLDLDGCRHGGDDPGHVLDHGRRDAALFEIVSGNLTFQAAKDFETDAHSYEVEVTADDGANTTAKLLTVNLTDENDCASDHDGLVAVGGGEHDAGGGLDLDGRGHGGDDPGHVLDHGRDRCGVVRDRGRQPGVQGGQGLRDGRRTATRWK